MLPPRPLLTARPPLSRGGRGSAVLLPASVRWVWGVLWAALCVWPVMLTTLSVSSLAVLWGRSPGLLNPTLTAAPCPWLAPMARAGSYLECSCICTCLVRVCLRAGGPVCQGVSMCVFANHPCFAAHSPSLFRGVRERWKTFPFFMGLHVCWPASVSARCTVPSVQTFVHLTNRHYGTVSVAG
jgi:hypothetical protein